MNQQTESILNKPQVKLVILRRIVGMTFLAVIVFFILLMLIFRSFSVMDGSANAINYSGSERMRTILLGYLGSSYIQALKENNSEKSLALFKMMQKEKKTYTSILSGLTEGNKKMGLVKTVDPAILSLIQKWKMEWLRFDNSLGIISDSNVPIEEKVNALKTIQVIKAVALKNTVHKVVLAYTDKSIQALRKAKELIIAILVVLVLMGTIMALLIRTNLLPIRKLLIVMNALENRDLTIRSGIPGNTEISKLSHALDGMASGFDELIGEIKKTSSSVDDTNNDLSSAVEESVSAVREMVASIDSVNSSLEKEKSVIEYNVKNVEEQKKRTQTIVNLIDNQTAAIEHSSASIEEMSASINEVSHNTEQAKHITGELSATANTGWEKINAVNQAMEDISSAAEKIQESVTGIRKIASTTNLLSMNASIEAAHAGDAGKGFAVVAEEINKLADSSAEEANKIKQQMAETLSFINTGMKLSHETGTAFKNILDSIQNTVTIIVMIADAMKEQAAASNEVMLNTNSLVEMTRKIKDTTGEEEQSSKKLIEAISNLENLSQEILNASNEQKIGGSELLTALDLLQEVSIRNKESIVVLDKHINKFTVSSS